MIKNILFSFLYFIIYCFPTQAAINTLVSGANWSTATWSLGRIPNNTDDVIIPSGATLSVDIDAICGSLKIANATANTTVNMAAGSSLIIDKTAGRTGNLTFGGSNNTGNYTLNVATGALTISGSVVYGTKGNCRVRVSSGVATIAELITLSGKDFLDFIAPGTGSVYLNGGLIDGAGTLTTLNGSNVYIKNTYTISANTTWAAGSIAFLNSTTINTGGKTLIFANLTLLQGNTTLSGGDIAITGNLEAKTGTNFNASSNTITLSGSYFGVGDLTFTTGTFNVAKDWINTGTFTCGTGTVNYNGNVAQNISNTIYYNLSYTTGATATTKTITGIVEVLGNLTATNGTRAVTLNVGANTVNLAGDYLGNGNITFTTGTLNIGGNWTNTGTFTCATGTVNYNGASAQTVKATTYNNLSFTNAGTKTIAAATTVNANWSMVNANVLVTAAVTGNATGTFTIDAGSTLFLGQISNATDILFPSGYTTAKISLDPASTVSYDANKNPQTISYVPTYGNLTIRTGSAAKTQTIPNVSIQGNLTATNGSAAVTLKVDANTVNLAGDYLGNGNITFTTGTLNIGGSWTNTGTFTCGTGTVNYNGASAQIIGAVNYYNLTSSSTGGRTLANNGTIGVGNVFTPGINAYTISGSTVNYYKAGAQSLAGITYNNLTCSASGVKTAAGNINIEGVCTLSGTVTLDADGSSNNYIFTLKSNATNTASIAAIPAGASFTGNIVGERFAPGGITGWAIIGPYTSGGTLAKWVDNFPMSGFPGSSGNAGGSFVSVYTYNETINDSADYRYVAATNITNPITPGTGYYVYLGNGQNTTSDITINTDGAIVQGAYNFFPSFSTNAYGISENGWNLIANPYPSAIDWDAAGWTKTRISTTVYLYNADIGNYATYTTGVGGTNGGSRYIASGQGFFVKATAASPALGIIETCKTNNNSTFLKQVNNQVASVQPNAFSFQLNGQGAYKDEAIVYFSEDGQAGFNPDEDALKLNGTDNGSVNLSTVVDGNNLTLNNLGNTLNTDIELFIKTTVVQSQNVTLSLLANQNFPAGLCMNLLDTYTGNTYHLFPGFTLSFYLSDTTKTPRFKLSLSRSVNVQVYSSGCSTLFSGVVLNSNQNSSVAIQNILNESVETLYLQANQKDSVQLAAGTYLLTTQNQSCGTSTDTVSIKDEKINVIANFDLGFDTLDISQNNQFTPINLSQNTETYSWYFNNQLATGVSPEFTVTQLGEQNIALISSLDFCKDTVYKYFYSINANPLNVISNLSKKIIITYLSTDEHILIKNKNLIKYNLSIFDVRGSVVFKQENILNEETLINVSNLSSGVYLLKITTDAAIDKSFRFVIRK